MRSSPRDDRDRELNQHLLTIADLLERNGKLRAALVKAHETIQALHGPLAWVEYQQSPEMKIINEALSNAKTGSG